MMTIIMMMGMAMRMAMLNGEVSESKYEYMNEWALSRSFLLFSLFLPILPDKKSTNFPNGGEEKPPSKLYTEKRNLLNQEKVTGDKDNKIERHYF